MVETVEAASIDELHKNLQELWIRQQSIAAALLTHGAAYYALCSDDKPDISFDAVVWSGSSPNSDSQEGPLRLRLAALPKAVFEALANEVVAHASQNYVTSWQEALENAQAAVEVCAAIAAKVAEAESTVGKQLPVKG